MSRILMRFTKILLCAVLASGALYAQEYKAVITGVITDSSKAVIPGAVITVHDLDTNQNSVVITNGVGSYRTNPLTPSDNYQLTVTAKGFKTSILAPFALSVDQTATANVVMQLGTVAEEVNVTSSNPLLDAQKADIGTVLDNKMISEMPIPSRSIFALAPLAAGVNNSVMGNTTQSYTPSTYESSTDFSVNGAGGNTTNVNVDGMSVLANVLGSNGVGITPIVDSVQEFKLVTSAYDASYGHSSATMDVALKAGTNTFHGAAWEYIRETFLDANTYLNNSQNPPTPQPSLSQNMFGGELDGPLYIPKLYSRAHKTFFMFSYERYHRNYPNFGYSDTVDPQWLTGDFSNLVNLNGQQIPIFDSSTANAANGYARTQFPNNQIPLSRLDPVALKILSYYPKANYFNVPGAQPYEQFFAHFAPSTELTPHYTFRIDQQIGSKDHAFVEFQHQRTEYVESEGVPGIGATGDLPEVSDSYNYGGDWTHTVKSNLLLDIRANYQRYIFTDTVAVNNGFDLTTLGLPAGLQSEVPGPRQFPVINLSSYLGLGGGVYLNASNTYNFTPDVIWTPGRHTVRFGTNVILSQYSPFTNNGGLTISASPSPSQEYFNAGGSSTPSNNSGNSVASLLLGGVGASVYVTDTAFYSYRYFAPWVQDDWRLTHRLTLDLGFRWDFQTPPTERHNRANSGFDATVVNPLTNQIPASFGPIHGGLTFAGVDGERRGPFNLDITNLQPRIGFAYTLYPNVVLRGGYGRYYTNSTIYSLPANFGYSYTANSVNSLNGGRNYLPNALDNPFPNGISPVPGNAQGLTTNAGQGIYYYDNNYKLPHSDSFSVGLEQTVGRKGVVSLNYVASRSVSQGSLDEDENLPMYASCDYTKGGNQSICQNLVNNPFYGLSDVNTSVSSQPQVSAYSLSVPYPQYTSVTNYGTFQPGARPYSWYNSMQLSYHAHTRDLDINASETWAKLIDIGGYTDSVYRLRARSIDSSDSAHHVIVNSVLQVPIGRGERVWGNMNRWTDLAIGGWRLGSIYTFVTGAPQSTGGLIPIGPVRTKGLQQTGSKIITSNLNPCVESWQFSNSVTGAGSWILTPGSQLLGCTAASWQVQTGYQPDTSQGITDQVRQPDYYDFDTNLSKTFTLVGRLQFQLRLEAYNVLNHPTFNENYSTNYNNGQFGTINKESTKQSNLPRQMQIAGRLTW